jgi:hypothetical protein
MSMRKSILSATSAVGLLFLVGASGAFGQQSKGQQKCLNKLNKDGAVVAKEQGKGDIGCLKDAGTGKLTDSAQSCLTADAKGKVQKKKSKTTADDAASCGTLPTFGYTGAVTTNASAVQGELNLAADIFGANLDAAVLTCKPIKAGCRCQQAVLGNVETLVGTKLAEFVTCKKTALKGGATSAAALSACVDAAGTPGSIAADTKGKILKAVTKLNASIGKSCDTPGVTAGAFPGTCTGTTGTALGSCLDARVECRVCQTINQIDGLFVDCDLFDDGVANASCSTGSGPTPTPTFTPEAPTPTATFTPEAPTPTPTSTPLALTPTPTATATCPPGPVFQGALTATVGRFNYNLTLGLPGANAACNSNFAGSHGCTYFELQCAQAAGSLVGVTDTSATLVTSFWAIDPSAAPLTQCVDDVGSNKNWEYGTAHTASRGQKVALDNPLGTLGPLQTGLQCNFSGNSSVGCCQ